jgi:hypothetical protein
VRGSATAAAELRGSRLKGTLTLAHVFLNKFVDSHYIVRFEQGLWIRDGQITATGADLAADKHVNAKSTTKTCSLIHKEDRW